MSVSLKDVDVGDGITGSCYGISSHDLRHHYADGQVSLWSGPALLQLDLLPDTRPATRTLSGSFSQRRRRGETAAPRHNLNRGPSRRDCRRWRLRLLATRHRTDLHSLLRCCLWTLWRICPLFCPGLERGQENQRAGWRSTAGGRLGRRHVPPHRRQAQLPQLLHLHKTIGISIRLPPLSRIPAYNRPQ